MSASEFARVTPYYNHHLKEGAEMYMKGGWVRPIRFKTPEEEALATRRSIGLIDGHSMGKIRVIGPDARAMMSFAMANDLTRAEVGRGAIYSCLCDENGGIVDDVVIYALADQEYFLITNTLSGPRVEKWLLTLAETYGFDAYVMNDTNKTAYLALQGPNVPELLDRFLPKSYRELKYFEFAHYQWDNVPILVARTGFTGEIGYEFCFPSEFGHDLWGRLQSLGADLGIQSVGGLGVQILRTEKSYRAYTLDMTQDDTPFEAGLGWSVRLGGHDFVGRAALEARKAQGVSSKLLGFEVNVPVSALGQDRDVFDADGNKVGRITSICDSPALAKTIAMARIDKTAWSQNKFTVGPATLTAVQMPFLDPQGTRLKASLVRVAELA